MLIGHDRWTMRGRTITQLDPADSVAMGRSYDLMVAVTRHDLPDFPTPSRQEHSARFEHPWPTFAEEALLAWDGDRVVGAASYLLPRTENLSMVYLEPQAPAAVRCVAALHIAGTAQ